MAYHTIQPVPLTVRQRWGFLAALVALAVVSSWTGVFNDFTYDDRLIILNNSPLHDLGNWWRFFGRPYWPVMWGGDGYRPLTVLLFSLEWVAGAGKPWVFHAVNIALYAAVPVAVFYLAETCLPFAAAWIAAALFAVHPVHVEAVGNVVGQAELLTAAFLLPALAIYIRRRNANTLGVGSMAVIAALYGLACLSKEHGIVLPALLLIAELIVVVDKNPLRARLTALRPFGLCLTLVAVAYLWAHLAVSADEATGFHPYVPFAMLGVGASGRAFTMFGLVSVWLRLFLWPAHLSSEYGPPAYPVVTDFQPYQIPGMIIIAAVLILGVASWRKAPAVSFGIWFAVITLLPTSNFLVPSGILISERTLFLPSVGVLIAVAALVPWLHRQLKGKALRVTGLVSVPVVLAAGAWRSMERTRVWRDNDTLFQATVLDSPRVYRVWFNYGAWDLQARKKVKGEREYLTAMALYDKDPYVFYGLGEEYREWKMYKPAITMFRRSLGVDSTMVEARARLALSLAGVGEWPGAYREAERSLKEDTRSTEAMLAVIRLYRKAMRLKAKSDSGHAIPAPTGQAGSSELQPPMQNTAPFTGAAFPMKRKPPI